MPYLHAQHGWYRIQAGHWPPSFSSKNQHQTVHPKVHMTFRYDACGSYSPQVRTPFGGRKQGLMPCDSG